ncbi:hypothetical protein ACHAW6_010523 [Cyclotella cf. meneghiniana]
MPKSCANVHDWMNTSSFETKLLNCDIINLLPMVHLMPLDLFQNTHNCHVHCIQMMVSLVIVMLIRMSVQVDLLQVPLSLPSLLMRNQVMLL